VGTGPDARCWLRRTRARWRARLNLSPQRGGARPGRPRTDGSQARAMAYSGCCQSFCLIGGWHAPGDAAQLGQGPARDQYDQRRRAVRARRGRWAW
jgi:hypothetical protein